MISDQSKADELLNEYATARTHLECVSSALEEALAKVGEVYLAGITEAQRAVHEAEADLRDFAKQHRREFNGDLRSYENCGWRFGYRKRPDSIKVRTADDVAIIALRQMMGFAFVRPHYELDRNALLRFLTRDSDDEFECIGRIERIEQILEYAGITLKRGADKFFIESAGEK